MSSISIFRDFKSAELFRNKYRRSQGIYEMWDANLHHGDIRPFACPKTICEDARKLNRLFYLPECECHGFPDGRDIVQGFCDNQFFHVDNGVLRQATTEELCLSRPMCRAGVPFQPQSPTVSRPKPCNNESCEGVAVSYVITYVTEHSGIRVEGSPSPASNPIASNGDVPGVSVTWADAPLDYCIVATRLYRTTTTFEDKEITPTSSEYVLVAEFSGTGVRTFVDDVSTADTGQPLMTYNPMRFPAPTNIVSLARTSDGIVVADTNRVYISLAGEPMFTFDGVVEVEDTILHIEALNNTIFVFTDRYPVKIGFSSSEVLQIDRQVINRNLPLKSKKSVSNYNGLIFFASEYSLYVWDTGKYGQDITSPVTALFTPEQWKNIDPTTVAGIAYEYGYIFTSESIDYSLMLEFSGDGVDSINGTSIMPISYINPHVFGLDYDGHIIYQEGPEIKRWDWRRDACTGMNINDHVRPVVCEMCDCCPWHVKVYLDNEGKNHFSHMRVEWDERSAPKIDLSFHVHEFGREIDRADILEVISSRGFGVPYHNTSYQSCYAYLTGCAIMHEVRFATSANELVYSSNANVET